MSIDISKATEKQKITWSNVVTAVVSPLILAGIYWALSYNTVDPELAQESRRLDVLEKIAAQNSISIKQSSESIAGLATDRAVTSLEKGYMTKAGLEAKYGDMPMREWSGADQDIYKAAVQQVKSAKLRLTP